MYYQDQYGDDSLDINDNRIRQEGEQVAVPSNEMIYRVQIGFYKKELSYDIFKGLSVTLIRGDGGTYYYTGAFTEHQDALIKCSEMKARGHKDAFIVTYKHGERISLHVAIKTEKKARKIKAVVEDEVKLNIKFTVQILVAKKSLSPKALKQMTPLGNIKKEEKGQEMYRWFAGTYSSLEDANTRLAEAKLAGFGDAFVFATLDGERITLKQAKRLLK